MSQSTPSRSKENGTFGLNIGQHTLEESKCCTLVKSPEVPIEWNVATGLKLSRWFKTLEWPLRRIQEIPFNEPLGSAIRRFFIALDAYEESTNRIQSIEDILQGCASGPSYADYLKKYRTACFLATFHGTFFEVDEKHWIRSMKGIKRIQDIGNVFNYLYLIPWKESDEEDYKWGFHPVKQDEKYLLKFRQCIRKILPDKVPIIIEEEVLLKNSGSLSLCNGVKQKRFKSKEISNTCSTKIGKGVRCIIPVGPKSYRDSVVIESNSLNRVNWIDLQTLEVLQKIEGHIMLKNEHLIDIKIKNFSKKNRFYIHRDIKKEGITKPRTLLKIMLEELKLKYPLAKAYEYIDFYDNFSLIINEKELFPERGHGLGMANSLTTLMQLAIMEIIKEEVQITNQFNIEYLCLNDDLTVSVETDDEVDIYWEAEVPILEGLSLIRANDKSFFINNAYVIAEKYWSKSFEDISFKESYKAREVLLCLAQPNICAAKEALDSATYTVNTAIVQKYIDEIINYWGYEFHKYEYLYPAILGGWFSTRIQGIDLSLLTLDKIPFNKYAWASYKACQEHRRIKDVYKEQKTVYSLLNTVFKNSSMRIPEEYKLLFDIGKISDIKGKYIRLKERPKLWLRSFQIWQRKRQSIFKKELTNTSKRFEDFLLELKGYPRDFYPHKSMIEKYIEVREQVGIFQDPYVGRNPRMSALKKYLDIPFDDLAEDYSIKFLDFFENNKKAGSSDQRKRMKQFQGENLIEFTGILSEFYYEAIKENENYIFQIGYINPSAIAICANLIRYDRRVPILKEKYWNTLSKSKEEVYNKILTMKEIILFNSKLFEKDRLLFKQFLDVTRDLDEEELHEFLVDYTVELEVKEIKISSQPFDRATFLMNLHQISEGNIFGERSDILFEVAQIEQDLEVSNSSKLEELLQETIDETQARNEENQNESSDEYFDQEEEPPDSKSSEENDY